MPRTAVLFQTHFLDTYSATQFARLRKSCPDDYYPFVLMHAPPGTPKPASLQNLPHHFVTTPEIRDPNYTGKSEGGPEWRIWAGGHTDLPVLHFFNDQSDFEAYWIMEYDVRFTGSWATLFRNFEGAADFATTNLRRRPGHPDWHYWDTLRPPPYYSGQRPTWPIPEADQIAGFMPIYRVSARAMRMMDQLYRRGWTGHIEVTWPTLLRASGLTIEDFGAYGEFTRAGNRGRYYSSNPTTGSFAPGSFVWRPSKWWAGLRPNRLVHPVKPLEATIKEHWWSARRQIITILRAEGAGLP